MIQKKFSRIATALVAVSAVALLTSAAQAQIGLTFTVDSTQSYITLNIPNFSYSGNTINLTGQNRTNGAPIGTAWSAGTTTGNTAFVSGTIATTVGGSFTGQTLTAIQFVAGANNLSAISSGNYRPNPAAYNAVTSVYANNGPGAGDYASVAHVILGNAALISFDNVTYDVGTNSALPASGSVGSGTFVTNDPLNPLNTGILNSTFSVQGLSLLFVGQLLPNDVASLGGLLTGNTTDGATYTYNGGDTNLNIKLPLSIPISIDVGGGVFINGTASGQIVANAPVPEPATIGLAGLGFVSLVTMVRRRRRLAHA
jgi:enamine deaminase RidA (YjgF/YER057c/UK114 family)